MPRLEKTIHSDLNGLKEIETLVKTFVTTFNLSPELYKRVSISVIEATNNAHEHGNKKDITKRIIVIAEMVDNQFKVTVSDEGEGFDYNNIIPDLTLPENIKEDEESGRGLFMMDILSNNLIFEKRGSSVTLVFDIAHIV